MKLPARLHRLGPLLSLAAGVVLALAAAAPAAEVLSQISIRNHRLGDGHYGELFVFPENVRDYSREAFYGWSFRHELRSGAVRELQIARVRTRGAYVLATDLFANGRFSTMSHTVLMVFPRSIRAAELFQVSPDGAGNLTVLAPDGSSFVIDGRKQSLRPGGDLRLGALGSPGTPPRLGHSGFHLTIRSVGRSPFLRGKPVQVTDGAGRTCELTTDDVFEFGGKPESDAFRFDTDTAFFAFVGSRCPGLRTPANWAAWTPPPGANLAASFRPAQRGVAAAVIVETATAKARSTDLVGVLYDFFRSTVWKPPAAKRAEPAAVAATARAARRAETVRLGPLTHVSTRRTVSVRPAAPAVHRSAPAAQTTAAAPPAPVVAVAAPAAAPSASSPPPAATYGVLGAPQPAAPPAVAAPAPASAVAPPVPVGIEPAKGPQGGMIPVLRRYLATSS